MDLTRIMKKYISNIFFITRYPVIVTACLLLIRRSPYHAMCYYNNLIFIAVYKIHVAKKTSLNFSSVEDMTDLVWTIP